MSSNSAAEVSAPKKINVQSIMKLCRFEVSSLQITVEYEAVPPQVWLSNLRQAVKDCRNFHAQLQFIEVTSIQQTPSLDQPGGHYVLYIICISIHINMLCPSRPQRRPNSGLVTPKGYSNGFPSLGGEEQHRPCPHCSCGPCVIQMPPDFLVGSSAPHECNREKRYK